MIKVPVTIQMYHGESGAATLHMMLSYYKKFLSIEDIRQHCDTSRSVTSVDQLVNAAKYFRLETRVCKNVTAEELKAMHFPVVISWDNKYFAIVRGFKNNKAYMNDAAYGSYKMTEEAFFRKFSARIAIIMTPGPEFEPGGRPVSTLSVIIGRAKNNKQAVKKIFYYNIILVGLSVFMLAVTREMMDKVINSGDMSALIPLGTVLIILLILRICISVIDVMDILRESRKMSAESGSRLYKTILKLPIKFFDSHPVGDIINRINMNMSIDQAFLRSTLPNVVNVLVTVVYLVMMYIYQPAFAAVFTAVEIANILVNVAIRSKTAVITKSMNVAESRVSSFTLNGVDMIETIKTSGAENNFFSSWTYSQARLDDNRREIMKMDSIAVFAASIHRILCTFILVFGGVWLMNKGYMSIGVLTVFQSVLNSMQDSLNQAISLTSELQLMRTKIERVDDVLKRTPEEEVELTGEPEEIKGQITINNISFSYAEGERPAVENFSLDMEQGEMIALVGHTGCGKSTVMKMLTGLYKPSSGEILYDGKNINEIPDSVFHAYVAAVDQDTMTFDGSVSDNIKLWDSYIDDYTMMQSARDARIYSSVVEKHGGFDKDIAENGRNFSGGEIQRIEIARALAHNPSVLILDEFTSALDVFTEKEVFEAVKRRNVSCIMAVHRLSTIMKCDRVIVMEKGKIIETGKPMELFTKDTAFARLVEQ